MEAAVSAWGDNANGQLGDGGTGQRSSPGPVGGLDGLDTVEAGSGHVLALRSDGIALGWGRNAFGQLGDGSTGNQTRPVPVVGLREVVAVAPGGGHSLFLREDGTVWGSGAGFFGCLGPEHQAVAPVPVRIPGLERITRIISGGGHCLALDADGVVWSWGRDDYGQLGDGATEGELPGRTVRQHAGKDYPCRFVPAPVAGLQGTRALAAGGGHNVALLPDGTVVSWGCNDRGQLGDGTMGIHRDTPAEVKGLTRVTGLTCAYHHTLALHEDGTVSAFGLNDRGQLGDGSTTDRTVPVPVTGLAGVVALAAKGGGADVPGDHGHSIALLTDGSIRTWGCNEHGELGDGSTDDRTVPGPVPGLPPVRHVTAGGEIPAFRENPGGGYALVLH